MLRNSVETYTPEPARGPTRLVRLGDVRSLRLWRFRSGLEGAQPLPGAVDEGGPVRGDPELVGAAHERRLLAGRDLDLVHRVLRRRLTPEVVARALHGCRQQDHRVAQRCDRDVPADLGDRAPVSTIRQYS